MNEREFEIEPGGLLEIKTLEYAPKDDGEVNDLLQEGWAVLHVKVVEITQERNLQDGSPYASTYPRVVWVLGRFEE